ncbi:MAG: hypothetical protein IPI29_06475 [Ignavibacteria bacterium]|nr:hypothetical protein [Ignavibacteria bacterium]
MPGQAPSTNLNGFVAMGFSTLLRNPPAETTFLYWFSLNVSRLTEDIAATSTYDVDYSTDMGMTWMKAATGLKTKSYSWTVPAQRQTLDLFYFGSLQRMDICRSLLHHT